MSRLIRLSVLLSAALLVGCGNGSSGNDRRPRDGQPTPRASPHTDVRERPASAAQLEVSQPGLALGITEPNPALIWEERSRPDVPEPFGRWRAELAATRPAVYRLMVSWRELQPRPGATDLAVPEGGCLRAKLPCGPWAGVREQLAALASRQRYEPGWRGMIVISDTPDWAAVAPNRCESGDAEPRLRPPAHDALPAYRALVRALAAEAARHGAHIRYWSAWNEPNHPYFLSPQRSPCDDRQSTPAAAEYVKLVRALDEELAELPGTERVLGELAGVLETGRHSTSVGQFIDALPRQLVCESRVWSQHDYRGGSQTVDAVWEALRRHECPRAPSVWITETGAGSPGHRLSAGAARVQRPAACRKLHRMLSGWWRDERVEVAIQYTWREDNFFPVGLTSTDLARPLPTLEAWKAWSGRSNPRTPPPLAPC
ncbi:MAG: hypothetical protein M3P40_02230 [Actinomycetota bacterium]|nr:hypothetical protein [Actinomycetota bacterium]